MDDTPRYKPKSGAAIWVVRAGRKGHYASDFEAEGIVAIRFHPVGDVSGLSRDQVTELVASQRPGKRAKVSGDAGMLYRFSNDMEVGDIVITPDGETRELLFGEVRGSYEYREAAPVSNFRHVRRVGWLGRLSREQLPGKVLRSLQSPQTIFQPKEQDYLLTLMPDLHRVSP